MKTLLLVPISCITILLMLNPTTSVLTACIIGYLLAALAVWYGCTLVGPLETYMQDEEEDN